MKRMAAFLLALIFVTHDAASEGPYPMESVHTVSIPIPVACHTQGMVLRDQMLYVSCVDRAKKRAYLFRLSLPALQDRKRQGEEQPDYVQADITDGNRYHPSGLDQSGDCLWVAVAEYRPYPATSRVLCIDAKTMEPGHSFEVKDHIGALAAFADRLVGANWDTKKLYLWDTRGRLIDVDESPLGFAAQDCKAGEQGTMVCGGTKKFMGILPAGGMISFVDARKNRINKWTVTKSLKTNKRSEKGLPLTNEGLEYIEGCFYFLPDDFPDSRLYIYRIPGFQP